MKTQLLSCGDNYAVNLCLVLQPNLHDRRTAEFILSLQSYDTHAQTHTQNQDSLTTRTDYNPLSASISRIISYVCEAKWDVHTDRRSGGGSRLRLSAAVDQVCVCGGLQMIV